MRHVLFALLVAVPAALVTWMVSRGVYGQPGSRCSAEERAAADAAADPDAALAALLATPIGEFSINGEVELFDRQGLFDYINGAAPLYIDRNFRKLAAAELTIGDSELTCDIYDMGEAANAASIFEAEATPHAEPADWGDAGRTSRMALVFREGRYYVKLTAFDDNAEKALPELAELLLERMP